MWVGDGVVWVREGGEGEERLNSLVAIERLRAHPAPVLHSE